MTIAQVARLSASQKQAILQLWNREYPSQLGYGEMSYFDNYLDGLTNQLHLVYYDDSDEIKGWAFSFERSRETWFAIIVDSSLHGKGIGSRLLDRLKQNNMLLNGWVTDHNRYIKQD